MKAIFHKENFAGQLPYTCSKEIELLSLCFIQLQVLKLQCLFWVCDIGSGGGRGWGAFNTELLAHFSGLQLSPCPFLL
jgi:hypothetical protein